MNRKICPACKHINVLGANYCFRCGQDISGVEAVEPDGIDVLQDQENHINAKMQQMNEDILTGILATLVVFTVFAPLLILAYQAYHWLKDGEWLSLPISVIGFESWVGLASLPLSLGAFVVGLVPTIILWKILS